MSDNKPICNVCNKNKSFAVCCSSMSPTSYAYCEKCHSEGLEPWGELVAAGFCTDCKTKSDVYQVFSREKAKKIISFHGKSMKDLLKEIKDANDAFMDEWK